LRIRQEVIKIPFMQTRCPNPKCRFVFDVNPDREGKNLPCPACGQVITVRSLELLKDLERRRAAAARQGALGSPSSAEPEKLQVLLEDIRSLWNVGSIFRTADGAGFGRVHLCGITPIPPRKEISKTALGADDYIPWEHHVSVVDILPRLRGAGVCLAALEENSRAIPLSQAVAEGRLQTPLCLLVGNEVSGLSAEAQSEADAVCSLPMRGRKNSLNVAVAFGVAAYMVSEKFLCRPTPRPSKPAEMDL
jgi:tRNA G18 (ribose-2'-O)-methylase SpoU